MYAARSLSSFSPGAVRTCKIMSFVFSFTTYCGLSEEEAEKAIVRYRERYIPIGVYECELFEGVRETIQAFKEAGYIQVITSSKPEAQCRQILEKFNLISELDEVVGASHDGKIDTKMQVIARGISSHGTAVC